MSKTRWKVYTDGSCINNGERGGYAAVICYDGRCVDKIYQGYLNTTNNRMELLAVIETLKYFPNPTELTIISDSQYVVNSINGEYYKKWIKEQDLSKKNLDLWFQLVDLLNYHTVTFQWVKGHNNHSMNEYADRLAQHSSQCMNLPEDLPTKIIKTTNVNKCI